MCPALFCLDLSCSNCMAIYRWIRQARAKRPLNWCYAYSYFSLLGLLAILQFFSAPGLIYWFVPSANVNFGPYVNRDHFAGLFEMLIPIAGTYYISAGRKSPFSLLWAFGLLIAVASLLFAGSRGGLLALTSELLLLVAIIMVRTRD